MRGPVLLRGAHQAAWRRQSRSGLGEAGRAHLWKVPQVRSDPGRRVGSARRRTEVTWTLSDFVEPQLLPSLVQQPQAAPPGSLRVLLLPVAGLLSSIPWLRSAGLEVRMLPMAGDHVKAYRGGFWHHGIYVGDHSVIHFTGADGKNAASASICRTSWRDFALQSERVEVVGYRVPVHPPPDVVNRAFSRIGAGGYSLLFNNCEHFALWCKTGQARSEQVRGFMTLAALVGGAWYLSKSA